ncbi:probable malonyl-CoA-acyl carrier protein transacylase, mitochondrial [Agrilus planipennis]|uniref:[acyl-carrier-protein] S-malonyltransferase n=1 Tax=Agrilus planipennis TaxID=224129 RepID=A0A1W4XH78_AGRPL|nr:probable malonyl-CoA-acyl carrier protein transacylase, mitochondrial [Agrilus planipennis]XP_025829617.1 probable malonyl-CoA-acyl carrier protein transacylase, mitochondrial [Agrilus planipennis]
MVLIKSSWCTFKKVLETRQNICKPACNSAVFKLKQRNFHCSVCNKEEANKKSEETPLKTLLEDAASFGDVQRNNVEQQWATLPYLQGTKIRKQGEYFHKPKVDPRNTSVILFPGQGSQFVGMAKDLLKFPMARDLFELANYILKYDLLKLCLEGPKSKLDETRYCQPAVMVTSLATLERLKEERPNAIENCVATAGFSLGEITALVFAGALGFERALQLVKIRAEAMHLASEAYKGGMATVFYTPESNLGKAVIKAKEWALERGAENPECCVANYLYPHCKVVSGSLEALDYLEKNLMEYKLKKIKRLPVSGAFHSSLMEPAVGPFLKALKKTEVSDPVISVFSNVDGKKYRDANHIRRQLPKQIVKPVRWEQLLHVIYERDQDEYFPKTFECGPGSSLKAILKQVNGKAWNHCITIN